MLQYIISKARPVVRAILDRSYHQRHKREALSALKAIEEQRGKLAPKIIRFANEYALDVFGNIHFAPWLYVYSSIAGIFKEGWIPDNYYGSVVAPAIKGDYGKISYLRGLAPLLFDQTYFPPSFYRVNGLFLRNDFTVITFKQLKDELFSGTTKAVFKGDHSERGHGTLLFGRDNFIESIIEKTGNGTFQAFIEQHPTLAELSPTSVATLRITTAIEDSGEPTVRASYLRLGRSTDEIVQSSTNVRVAVDIRTGRLALEGYRPSWQILYQHPDTGVRFGNYVYPEFQTCLDMVLRLHRRIPFARCIGWDVTVNSACQPLIMEWNGGHNDIKFTEATQGPCFDGLGWDKLWRTCLS